MGRPHIRLVCNFGFFGFTSMMTIISSCFSMLFILLFVFVKMKFFGQRVNMTDYFKLQSYIQGPYHPRQVVEGKNCDRAGRRENAKCNQNSYVKMQSQISRHECCPFAHIEVFPLKT